ncbi:MAG: hypothetical protein GVY24_02935 [Planctomycetes bacterium]|nr:hypothetical protein [Planctomycetota bacterium]
MLIAFVDVNQRASRHALKQLVRRAKQQAGPPLIVVQLGPADARLIDRLNVDLPLAKPRSTMQVRLQWGVRGLPWYVLVDAAGKAAHAGTCAPPHRRTPDNRPHVHGRMSACQRVGEPDKIKSVRCHP